MVLIRLKIQPRKVGSMINELPHPEYHQTLDEVLAHWIKKESEIGQGLIERGADPGAVAHMQNVHFFEFCTEVFGHKWMHELQQLGLKPKTNGRVAP